jgi:hypothetical protein
MIAESENEIASQVARLLLDLDACKRLGAAGRKTFEQRFSIRAAITTLANESILAQVRAAPPAILDASCRGEIKHG